jgi:predicted enzyme related to lactoylglutathione lyase
VVDSIGRALAFAPSLPRAARAWRALGFSCGREFVFQGCRAFDIRLAECGARFVRPDASLPGSPFRDAVARRLAAGAGLVGWTWACRSPERSRTLIERIGHAHFRRDERGDKSFAVPELRTAGALTFLEPLTHESPPCHDNGVEGLDHIVLMVSDADSAAAALADVFRLRPHVREMKGGRYAFCKVGGTVLEIVGPAQPQPQAPTDGRIWGLTFTSGDLDRTVATLRANGMALPDPHPAIQGGRIVSVPSQIGGMQVAFMGR